MIMEPGETLTECKGVKLYVKMIDRQTTCENLDQMKWQIAQVAGYLLNDLFNSLNKAKCLLSSFMISSISFS